MAPLAVDPAALDGAGAAVVSAGESLGSVISALTAALAGCAGMAGDDPVGARLGRSYDLSASRLVEAMVTTRNGVCGLGDGVRVSAHNYSLAEALSDVSGRGAPLAAPPLTTGFSAGYAPSSVGTTIGPPPGWGWVARYIGMIWPTGNSGRLRAAAAAWTAAGTEFALAEIEVTGPPMQVIRGQQMPEGPAIEAAISDAYASTTAVVQQCRTLATHLTNYADRLDVVHAAVLDLLARICDPMTGFKEAWDVLTGEDEDEIRRIANDICTVIENFAAEADALRAQIAAVIPAAAMAASRVLGYAAKGWGLAFTGLGQRLEGIGEEAFGVVKGLAEISQPRALLDPVGYLKSLGQVESGLLPLVGAGGEHGPGVSEAWKELGKGVAHWDEWKTNPFKALGETEFDLATLLLPGGPVSKLADRSRRLVGSLRKPPSELLPEPKVGVAPPKPPVESPPEVRPPEARPPEAKPPEARPPKSDVPAPTGKPEPAPPGAASPHSPTESKPQAAAKAPTAVSPKPADAPPESHPAPHGLGTPADEHLPSPPPRTSETVSPPALTPPNEYPAASAPAGAHSSQPGGAVSASQMPPPASRLAPIEPPDPVPNGANGTLNSHPTEASAPPATAAPAGGSEPNFPVAGGECSSPVTRLTSEDLFALADDTGSGYQELNTALRSGALESSHQTRISALMKALDKLPPHNGLVVRGTNLPADVLARYQSGGIITEEVFISTTTNPAVAASPVFAGNVEFRILSISGRDVSSVSMYPEEQEILFPPGTQFYIASKTLDPETGRTIIEMIGR